jgi:hypothetical protein
LLDDWVSQLGDVGVAVRRWQADLIAGLGSALT